MFDKSLLMTGFERGSQVSEATALPTEPQTLFFFLSCVSRPLLPPSLSLSLCNWMGHPNINFFLNFVCLNSFHFLLILHIGLLSLNSLSLVYFLDLVSMHFLLCLERGLSEKVNK